MKFLVANKTDLLFQDDSVGTVEATKYAKTIKASYFEVSAKENEGINNLFLKLAKKMYEIVPPTPAVSREKLAEPS